MIVTDRFADGDPANDGEVDRSAPDKRHGGDLLGIIHRMPYLKALGVTALWITPVYPNPPDAYHGYHPLDFESVDAHLCSPELGPSGSREVVRRFVEIAHEHGLKVIFDAIVCHTAPDHPWLKERPTWFNEDSRTPEKWWIWGLPDLNHDNINVNLYFAMNVLEWISSTGVDAVRIDAARHIERQFWRVFKLFSKGLRPDVTLIGEVWDADPSQVAPYQAFHGFDSMFDYPLYHALVDVFANDHGFGRIARAELSDDEPPGILNQDEGYQNAYHLITFLENHDTPRFFRLAGGAERREEALLRTKLALTFLFTTRGIPQLYYGAELAMDGGPHPDNRRDMPWTLIDEHGTASTEVRHAQDMLCFTDGLIRMRRSSMALRYGLLTTLYVTPTLYAFARTFPGDVRLVVLNNASEAADVTIPLHANPRLPVLARCHLHDGVLLENEVHPGDRIQITDGGIRVHLAGKTGAIYRGIQSEIPHHCVEDACFCGRRLEKQAAPRGAGGGGSFLPVETPCHASPNDQQRLIQPQSGAVRDGHGGDAAPRGER
jgi:alpha-amylase